MRDYFKRLKDHPGTSVATMMTLLGFLAGATNKTAEWWVGGLFGMSFCIILFWGAVLITNFKRGPKEIYKPKPRKAKNIQKLSLLHYIQTDKANYHIYNIECIEGTNVSVWIERDGKSILEPEIFEESWGTMGGDSFSRFVLSCLDVLRDDIKKRGEFVIKDEKVEKQKNEIY